MWQEKGKGAHAGLAELGVSRHVGQHSMAGQQHRAAWHMTLAVSSGWFPLA